jgi:hypothetical protein
MVPIFYDKYKHVQYGSDKQQNKSVEVYASQNGPRIVVGEIGEDAVDVVTVEEGEESDSRAVEVHKLRDVRGGRREKGGG